MDEDSTPRQASGHWPTYADARQFRNKARGILNQYVDQHNRHCRRSGNVLSRGTKWQIRPYADRRPGPRLRLLRLFWTQDFRSHGNRRRLVQKTWCRAQSGGHRRSRGTSLCAADLAPLRSGEHRAPVARALQHLRRRRRAGGGVTAHSGRTRPSITHGIVSRRHSSPFG